MHHAPVLRHRHVVAISNDVCRVLLIWHKLYFTVPSRYPTPPATSFIVFFFYDETERVAEPPPLSTMHFDYCMGANFGRFSRLLRGVYGRVSAGAASDSTQ
jgi:hypothetical protein